MKKNGACVMLNLFQHPSKARLRRNSYSLRWILKRVQDDTIEIFYTNNWIKA